MPDSGALAAPAARADGRGNGGALAWLLSLAPPAGAQTPGLGLAVTTSQTLCYHGATLRLSLGVANPGVGATADFYAGVILPDGRRW